MRAQAVIDVVQSLLEVEHRVTIPNFETFQLTGDQFSKQLERIGFNQWHYWPMAYTYVAHSIAI